MLKIYHVSGTRSVRTLWLVKELGLAHETVAMPFDHAVMHGPDYLRVNPLGKVPAIDDDGFVLTESGAITQYLLAKFGEGRLEPSPRPQPGGSEHGRFLQWLHFPEATMMGPLGTLVRQHRLPEDRRDRATVDHAVGKAGEALAFCDLALRSSDHILGPAFTAADIMLGYSLSLADQLGLVDDRHPSVRAYLARLRARPAFGEALAA
ncbi:glutathione S-transferase family protein [Phenylobacterium sp.]|uniref:glutathione S-transferase family protein n=1 Tax=Phenylobacterium sp. TaxID=1871053 RepID=UPI002733F231|nr:glutathione S-transferase family protein [Phenylobacterium sp.]MDP3853508.1 glutathione S-transferase family protein [Phenylobacterium sp.]